MKLTGMLRRKPTDGMHDPAPKPRRFRLRLRRRRSEPAPEVPYDPREPEAKPRTRVGRMLRWFPRIVPRRRRKQAPEATWISTGTGVPAARWDGPPNTPA